jgi:hypothetical protein
MKLVRLSETVHVNPAEIASVVLPDRADYVLVTMRNGERHTVERSYNGTRWEKYDQIIRAIAVTMQNSAQ